MQDDSDIANRRRSPGSLCRETGHHSPARLYKVDGPAKLMRRIRAIRGPLRWRLLHLLRIHYVRNCHCQRSELKAAIALLQSKNGARRSASPRASRRRTSRPCRSRTSILSSSAHRSNLASSTRTRRTRRCQVLHEQTISVRCVRSAPCSLRDRAPVHELA